MKTATLLLALLFSTAAFAVSPEEQQLIDLEHAWAKALMKGDAAALESIFAEEYLATGPDGHAVTKTQDIANTRTGEFKMSAYKFDDLQVHLYGGTATVTGTNTITATFKGEDVTGSYRFTDVFVKRDGRWQCVATQGTKIAAH